MKPSGAHTWPLTYGCFLRHPLRVNPSVVTDSIWIFDECPTLHFSLEVLLTITVRQPKLHRIQHLYLVFVVTAGADCLVCFCICLVCDTLNRCRDTKQPTIPVSVISLNPYPDGCAAPQHVFGEKNCIHGQT